MSDNDETGKSYLLLSYSNMILFDLVQHKIFHLSLSINNIGRSDHTYLIMLFCLLFTITYKRKA